MRLHQTIWRLQAQLTESCSQAPANSRARILQINDLDMTSSPWSSGVAKQHRFRASARCQLRTDVQLRTTSCSLKTATWRNFEDSFRAPFGPLLSIGTS